MSGRQLHLSEELGRLGLPEAAVAVNRRVWYQDLHDVRSVFVDQTPFYTYPLADETQHRFCAVQLVEAELARAKEVCLAFGIHPRKSSRIPHHSKSLKLHHPPARRNFAKAQRSIILADTSAT